MVASMTHGPAYGDLIQLIVRDKMRAFGTLAVRKLAHIQGLQVDDTGAVLALQGDPLQLLDQVVASYEKLAGPSSVVFAKRAIAPVLGKYPDLPLPPRLR